MLRPCTRYSDSTFKNIIEGAGMQKEKEDLSKHLIENLESIRENNARYQVPYNRFPDIPNEKPIDWEHTA